MQGDAWLYLIALGVLFLGATWVAPPFVKKNGSSEGKGPDPGEVLLLLKQDMDSRFLELRREVTDLRAELAASTAKTAATPDLMLLDNRYRDIFDLKKQGKTHEEIARQLEMGTGEVDLIIQLHAMADGRQRAGVRGRR